MFNKLTKDRKGQRIKQEIERLHNTLERLDPTGTETVVIRRTYKESGNIEEYETTTGKEYEVVLARLNELYATQAENLKRRATTLTSLALIAGSFAEVVFILNYEELHVATSKAFARIVRTK